MQKKRRSLLEWERDAIVAAVKAGENEGALAAEFNISPSYPHVLARRRGVPAKMWGRPRKNVHLSGAGLMSLTELPSRAAMVPAACREDRDGSETQGPIA